MENKELDNNNDIISDKKNKGDESDAPLFSLSEIYTSPNYINLFIINNNKTHLKHVLSREIKPIENEIPLLFVLQGSIKTSIDESIIADLRNYFKITKQIGFNPNTEYDFIFKSNKNLLHELKMYQKIQKAHDVRNNLKEF